MKHLVIIVGPQGSGNHLWSKILSVHPAVLGWQALRDNYWIGHDDEPFNRYWQNPHHISEFDWSLSDYYVTSISVPYMQNGESTVPHIDAFYLAASRHANVSLCVLGRDRNIVGMQQQRVRGGETLPIMLSLLKDLESPVSMFLSFELLHLYRTLYLKQISTQLSFPVAWDDATIDEILAEDSNAKYFHPVQHYWVDDLAHQTSRRRNA